MQAAPFATVPTLKSTNMNRTLFFLFCCLFVPFIGMAQSAQPPTLTLANIQQFKQHYQQVLEIEPQEISYKDGYFLRFEELGKIYNPTFPKTRNKVSTHSFWQQATKLGYIGRSISTYRATVQLKGRVGQFYGIWETATCNSLIEYEVTKQGETLHVTGKIYQCFTI